MKEFINKLQQDLTKLQKTLEKEGQDLLKKVKTAADKVAKNKKMQQTQNELERLIKSGLKQVEPAVSKFVTGVRENAKKFGINLSDLEKRVNNATRVAKTQMKKLKRKITVTKKNTATKAKKTTKTVKKKTQK